MRDAAKAHGLTNMAVQVTQTATELHCSGALAALDSFHAALLAALESETAYKRIDGLVTATDRDVALTVRDTVAELAATVPVEPTAMEIDDAVRRRVQFGGDDAPTDDETSTQATGEVRYM